MSEQVSRAVDYRKTAAKLRRLASYMRSWTSRRDLLELAERFERLAQRVASHEDDDAPKDE